MLSPALIARIWLLTSICLGIGVCLWNIADESDFALLFLIIGTPFSQLVSIPAWILMYIAFSFISIRKTVATNYTILFTVLLIITAGYGLFITTTFGIFDHSSADSFWQSLSLSTAALFASAIGAVLLSYKRITAYFLHHLPLSTQINHHMETGYPITQQSFDPKPSQSNKTLIKGLITGALILVLLIPTFFISGLVTERQERKDKIISEASNSWAGNQVLSGPYIYVPLVDSKDHVTILPESSVVNGQIFPEDRERSIYKVLLYKSAINANGRFRFSLPKDVDTNKLDLQNAQLCFGITDFKGIEDKIAVSFNNKEYELTPGLPTDDVDSNGLSAPLVLSTADIQQEIPFAYNMKIKGSGRLHFIPASGNSSFTLTSKWPNPSFDGMTIPNERHVSDSGFTAKWIFNKANLPFGTVLHNNKTIKEKIDFGVSILQPVDDYAKTTRCIKYAVMFIGLTFSLFFIVEIMQKKPLHPVQYVLVGLALVIFYSLLLSISEFIHFDLAYLIASVATVSLISLYAKSHFKTWKIAGLFAGVLGSLYAFNYVMISLEDTSLLVGSVALFIVLAIVMYASRKVNWYGSTALSHEPA